MTCVSRPWCTHTQNHCPDPSLWVLACGSRPTVHACTWISHRACTFWPTEREHTATLPTALALPVSPCPWCVCTQCLHRDPGPWVLSHGSQTVVCTHPAPLRRSQPMGPSLHLPVHSARMLIAEDLALSSGCGDESLEHGQGKALGR